jgi:hypothetical protein
MLEDTAAIEEVTPLTEETAHPADVAMTETTFEPQGHAECAALSARLDTAEATVARLTSALSVPLQMSLGPAEIALIAAALKPYHEAHIMELLQKHFRMSGLPITG